MVDVLRATTRLVLIAAATAVLYAIYRAGPRTRSWRDRMVRRWARTLSRLLGMRASIDGPRPAGTFLLVANHVSYVDILLLAQAVDVRFVAKSDVRQWPFIGKLAESVGTIFVDRESRRDALRVSDAMRDAISSGAAVALFPEGTSSDGMDVLPFKSTLLAVATSEETFVHYAAIRYDDPRVAWFGDMTLLPHVWSLLKVRRIEASLRFGGPLVSQDRKRLAVELHHAVQVQVLA